MKRQCPCKSTCHVLKILGLVGPIGMTATEIDRNVRDNTGGFRSRREFLRILENLPGVERHGDRWRLTC